MFQNKIGGLEALFSRQSDWNWAVWMEQTLRVIHPNLTWECGVAIEPSGQQMVITLEKEQHLRPLTATTVTRTAQLARWEFYTYRLSKDVEMVQQAVEARTGGHLDGVTVEARLGDHHLIDLIFHSPQKAGNVDAEALYDVFIAAETLLGEKLLNHRIGRSRSVQTIGVALVDYSPEARDRCPEYRWIT